MNSQNSKEDNYVQTTNILQIQSKHIDAVSHCIAFNQQKGLITIGNEGQLNLYLQDAQGKYKHKSTNKIFYCPVVAYDLLQQGKHYKLLLVSFDNRIAACKIQNCQQIIVYKLFKLQEKEAIVSCVWGNLQNEIILGAQKGHLVIVDIITNSILRECRFECGPLKLLRFGRDEVYLCANGQISKLKFEKEIKSIIIFNQSLIGHNFHIIDFAITQQQSYNSLVLLSQSKICFLTLERMKILEILELKNKVKAGRLGWGKDYTQIGIYETSKNNSFVELYSKNINGIWAANRL